MTQYKESIHLFLAAILAGYAILGLFLLVPAILPLGPLFTLLVIIVAILIVLFALAIILKALAKLFKFGKY
ncbi:hypothetical protein AV656_09390 [Bhargavaea cecembensis]|uniref:Uncharacterized protein n=1 Tax=Bhargavaea cecembensis TaxID=394098 RepID=A0A163F1N0_9BACL|nr:hypothetical protein [Bhargavaea cecembensis]KZE37737.1 hypothetical protein AV656_09390 [Bhargavaea cecembensis]